MKIWIDAQLSPHLAPWINSEFSNLEALSVKQLGLRDAEDLEIYLAARKAQAIIMTKDEDFVSLLKRKGPPPQVIWITCGNTSNTYLKSLLEFHLPSAIDLLKKVDLVEISG